MDELNKQYREACKNQCKANISQLVCDYIDDDSIDSVRKQTVLDMIASLIAMR